MQYCCYSHCGVATALRRKRCGSSGGGGGRGVAKKGLSFFNVSFFNVSEHADGERPRTSANLKVPKDASAETFPMLPCDSIYSSAFAVGMLRKLRWQRRGRGRRRGSLRHWVSGSNPRQRNLKNRLRPNSRRSTTKSNHSRRAHTHARACTHARTHARTHDRRRQRCCRLRSRR